ncbi:thioesterase II family protein [Streptomyces sp. NPDC087866]|uniref:thioesterase II family protein n=1 Tax=unclassified Streptomyces TaxID=2593676 RepID=UPI00224F6417|nr:alpha/beta fold hydrolase [Streptomyces sp. NBC_01789]MCX4448234.1 alpha/beta fold hydrolase [Streptomyces sp. NBC_01789]
MLLTGFFATHPESQAETDAESGRRWLRRYHPGASRRVVLAALPHAGGAASSYHSLSRALAPDVETLAVQYPGRQDRLHEPGLRDIEHMADQVVRALGAWSGPLALFGHSMGATVAFEVARRLEASHRAPAALIVSARSAPSAESRWHRQDVRDEVLVEEMRALGGSDAALADEELLSLALPALRSDFTAVGRYRYRPGPPLSCPITALVGDQDPRVDADGMRDWARYTDGGFALHVLKGGHFYLADQMDAVTRLVRGALVPYLG